jgi:hypothetical protein
MLSGKLLLKTLLLMPGALLPFHVLLGLLFLGAGDRSEGNLRIAAADPSSPRDFFLVFSRTCSALLEGQKFPGGCLGACRGNGSLLR